jgi:hypothetical protein
MWYSNGELNKPEEPIKPQAVEYPKKKVGGFWNFFKGK